MSGYLQYSNYGDEDETPVKRKIPMPPAPNQSEVTKPNQQKRILRTNQKTLRSRPPIEQQHGQHRQPDQHRQPEQPGQQHKYVQELIQNIHNHENGSASDEENDDGDNNYAPLAPSSNNLIQEQFKRGREHMLPQKFEASPSIRAPGMGFAPAKEAFSLQGIKDLANQYMPSVFTSSSSNAGAESPENKDVLLQKLDHIIQLLETQQDEKTGHVTEELVLYCFLGVFIIFIVDSFARAGKYVR